MVATGIIDNLLHPPIQSMKPTVDPRGPYSGNVTLADTGNGQFVFDTFGVIVVPATIGINLGRQRGYVSDDGLYDASYYHDELAQVSAWYHFVFGFTQMAQVDYVHYFNQLILWDRMGPTFVGLHVLPSVTVDLYWLTLPF